MDMDSKLIPSDDGGGSVNVPHDTDNDNADYYENLDDNVKDEEVIKDSYETFNKNDDTEPIAGTSNVESDNERVTKPNLLSLRVRCLKNIILIGIAGFASHIVQEVTASIGSSLSANVIRALTVKAYSVIVGCYLAPLVINIIGSKYCLVAGPLVSLCFIATFLDQQIILLITVSTIYGLVIGIFYVSALFHMMDCTFAYVEITSMCIKKASSFTNAYLWMMFSLSGLLGNLIISIHFENYKNVTTPFSDFDTVCGNRFCPDALANNSVIIPPTQESLNILVYILIAITAVGFTITALFMENLESELFSAKIKNSREIWRDVLSVLQIFGDVRMLLLAPIIVVHGMVQMYPDVDYTQGYVTCMIGVQNVGFVMVCATGMSSIGAFVSGSVGTLVHPRYIIASAFTGLFIILLILLVKNLNPDDPEFIYLVPAAFGFCDGLARTQISAYTVVLLKEKSDSAASAYFMMNILGHSLIFTWSIYICMYIKISILMILFVLSFGSFMIVDMREKNRCTDIIPENYVKKK